MKPEQQVRAVRDGAQRALSMMSAAGITAETDADFAAIESAVDTLSWVLDEEGTS